MVEVWAGQSEMYSISEGVAIYDSYITYEVAQDVGSFS